MTSPPAYEKARTFGVRVFFGFGEGFAPLCFAEAFQGALEEQPALSTNPVSRRQSNSAGDVAL